MWQENFNCGNPLIDAQHRNLFQMTNELLGAIESATPIFVIAERVTQLLKELAKHFHDEEEILEAVQFPDRKLHAGEHARLYQKSLELARMFNADNPPLGEIYKFLVYEVVFRHMALADRDFFPFIGKVSTPSKMRTEQ